MAEGKKEFLARCKRDFCAEVVEILANGQQDVVVEIDISKKRKCAYTAPSLQFLKVGESAKIKVRILVFALSSGEHATTRKSHCGLSMRNIFFNFREPLRQLLTDYQRE